MSKTRSYKVSEDKDRVLAERLWGSRDKLSEHMHGVIAKKLGFRVAPPITQESDLSRASLNLEIGLDEMLIPAKLNDKSENNYAELWAIYRDVYGEEEGVDSGSAARRMVSMRLLDYLFPKRDRDFVSPN